jgi:hypothetical protein
LRPERPGGIRGLALRACALTLAALAAGCGGSDEPEQPLQVGEAGGLEVYEVSSQDFSIGVPPEWRVISVDEALPEEERKELARENPDFAPMLEALADESQPIKLFAFDPDVRDGFATNVNVIAVELPDGVGLDEFVSANKGDIERFSGLSADVETASVELPGGPAERLDYRLQVTSAGTAQEVATRQYLTLGDGAGYVVTFSTLPQHSARYDPVFERIVRSLSLD